MQGTTQLAIPRFSTAVGIPTERPIRALIRVRMRIIGKGLDHSCVVQAASHEEATELALDGARRTWRGASFAITSVVQL